MAQVITVVIPKNANVVIDTSNIRTTPVIKVVEASEVVGSSGWSNASQETPQK